MVQESSHSICSQTPRPISAQCCAVAAAAAAAAVAMDTRAVSVPVVSCHTQWRVNVGSEGTLVAVRKISVCGKVYTLFLQSLYIAGRTIKSGRFVRQTDCCRISIATMDFCSDVLVFCTPFLKRFLKNSSGFFMLSGQLNVTAHSALLQNGL